MDAPETESICISFKDNRLLPTLFGEQNAHLHKLESQLGVSVASRGNMVSISGDARDVYISESVLKSVYHKLENGMELSEGEFDGVIKLYSQSVAAEVAQNRHDTAVPVEQTGNSTNGEKQNTMDVAEAAPPARGTNGNGSAAVQQKEWDNKGIQTLKKVISPYSVRQGGYIYALMQGQVTFAAGPAGTGKTYLAVAAAVAQFLAHKVDRIILSRPAVEAGEKLGFLPGDMQEKIDPYLRPLYDALHDMLPAERVAHCLQNGEIEIAPLAFMRGRTLRHAYVILDEAQNTTPVQMKMFLTRLGEGSQMAITGDLSQIDLPSNTTSGFRDAIEKLQSVEEVAIVRLDDKDIVRHPLTVKIVQAYERAEQNK